MMNRYSMFIRQMLCLILILHWPFSVSLMARPVSNPQPAQPQIIVTPQDVLDDMAEIFEDLFGVQYDPDQWTYPLSEQVTGPGEYSGVNHLGQPFTLNVIVTEPVDIASLSDLTLQEMRFALNNGFAYMGVIGILSTDLASVPISGLAVYQSNTTIPFDSRLVVTRKENPNNPIFSETQQLTGDGPTLGFIPILIPILCPDPDCVDDCESARDDCIAAAQSEHAAGVAAAQATMDAAQAAYDAAQTSAQNIYDTLMDTATTTLATKLAIATATITAAHIKCAFVGALLWWTGPAAILVCVIAAQAVYAATVAGALMAYNTAKDNAQAAYDAVMGPAQAAYGAAVQAFNQALSDLANELQDDLDECQEDFEDCMDNCPWVICGWIVILVPIGY
jgi:hypothetical protein